MTSIISSVLVLGIICGVLRNTVMADESSHGCDSVFEVSKKLWANDINRLPDSAFQLDFQGNTTSSSSNDMASHKLFSSVDESLLNKPTYQAYIAMMDNYDPIKGVGEVTTPDEENEVSHFLDVVMQTKVMKVLYHFQKCRDNLTNPSDFQDKLYQLWFAEYPRSSKKTELDTSGFEHVMVGEFKSSVRVNGFHGWLSFYLKEKANQINYLGYVRKDDPHVVAASFIWNGRKKPYGSFAIGTSPEYDLALFTLCFLTHTNEPCNVSLGGHNYTVQTYTTGGHVATAFVAI